MYTTCTFDLLLQCIVVGDSEGHLAVYQLKGMPEPPACQVRQSQSHTLIISLNITHFICKGCLHDKFSPGFVGRIKCVYV